MLNNHCVTTLINLKRVKFKNIDIQADKASFFVIPEYDVVMCPGCSQLTSKLVDTTPKVYKDLNVLNRVCHIEIDHRRFECGEYFKTFMEPLIFAGPNRHYTYRKKDTLKAFLGGLSEDIKHSIKAVAIDLWSAYRSAVEEELPQAIIVADRFHVMQNLNRAQDN